MSNTQQDNSATLLRHLEQSAVYQAEALYTSKPNWLVKNQQGQILFHLESKTGLRYPYQQRPQDLTAEWDAKLKTSLFWELASDFSLENGKVTCKSSAPILILDMAKIWVWYWFSDFGEKTALQAQTAVSHAEYDNLTGWQLPYKATFIFFRDQPGNPARRGGYYRLYSGRYWACSEGWMDIDYEDPSPDSSRSGNVIAYHTLPKDNPIAFWSLMRQQGMKVVCRAADVLLEIPDFSRFQNADWIPLPFRNIWDALMQENWILVAEDESTHVIAPTRMMQEGLLNMDYTPCRLPKLEPVQLTDPNKGLWELYGQDEGQLKDLGLRARNPAQDTHDNWVAIDFGTSSSVVAVSTPSRGKRLLRVGVQDFYAAVKAKDYENPTALEFVNLRAFLSTWNSQVYRPTLNWDWVKAAHEALEDFRSHAKNPQMVKSVLLHLKRWALEADHVVHRITDQDNGQELLLEPLREFFPVRGQALQPCSDVPLDVIELYAWYLGMTINWRQHGLYLHYAMTFPVKYPRELRRKILASFSRGLQRSLPQSLLADSAAMNDFEVVDTADEPMAYAAAVLPTLDLKATSEGLAYAVFDFGGGTTDFDFGLWRLPTQEEEDEEGADGVLERLGAGGDPYLGGENLLALVAYQVFQANREVVQEKKLVFTRPESEPAFLGSEAMLDSSAVAQSNTAMLMQELRPLLEQPDSFDHAALTMDLLDHKGEIHSVKLELDVEFLLALLAERVKRGVEGFLSEMAAAFAEESPYRVQVLLAGNASRGRWVREAFDTESSEWAEWIERYFADHVPEFDIHFAVGAEEAGLEKPNCKTSVALGALKLVRGSALLKKDRLYARSQGEAPFKYFVGTLRRGELRHVLEPGSAYHEWHDLGIIREGVFLLCWSASPRARNGMEEGDSELRTRDVSLAGAGNGYRCFGRVVSTGQIELVASASREALDADAQAQTLIPIPINLDA